MVVFRWICAHWQDKVLLDIIQSIQIFRHLMWYFIFVDDPPQAQGYWDGLRSPAAPNGTRL